MTRKPSAALALVAVLTLVLGLAPQSASADISPTTPAGRAANWLLREAHNGAIPRSDGQPDWQLTSDTVLGLISAGATPSQLAPFVARLEQAVAAGQYGMLGTFVDGGALAKLLVMANATGVDPGDFGGVDLVSKIRADVEDDDLVGNSQVAGNTFGQAYVVLGLLGRSADARSAVTGLLQQQCPAGDFRLTLGATACSTGAAAADRDVTALAIHALRAAERKGMNVSAPLDKAVEWLAKDQLPGGGWVGGSSTNVANSNTTGLAVLALAGVKPMVVSRAAGFTKSLQVTGGSDDGAVAYTAAALAKGTATNRFQWHRATAQAIFALAQWDVYTVEGTHNYNGRQWRTDCEPYSQTFRCRTDIHATTVVNTSGKLVKTTGWTFNNLTYLPSPRTLWSSNPLGAYGRVTGTATWTASDGRRWRTECDNSTTGRNGCRSQVWVRFVAATQGPNGWTYAMDEDWVFNNIVKFN